jgi:hypothetical protein
MKKILAMMLIVTAAFTVQAQKVSWTYSAKKLADGKYEVRITATIPSGWHLYSQNTPDGVGMGIPTKITFNKNALLTMNGKTKEVGTLKTEVDKTSKAKIMYYVNKVEFVQVVKLKGKVKTNISGTVESMICDDSKCLPPTTEKFNVSLN